MHSRQNDRVVFTMPNAIMTSAILEFSVIHVERALHSGRCEVFTRQTSACCLSSTSSQNEILRTLDWNLHSAAPTEGGPRVRFTCASFTRAWLSNQLTDRPAESPLRLCLNSSYCIVRTHQVLQKKKENNLQHGDCGSLHRI